MRGARVGDVVFQVVGELGQVFLHARLLVGRQRYLDEWFGLDKEAHVKSLEMSYARGSINPTPNGLKVACIGAGVASLTCAHDLLRLGYAVDVYEMMRMPGGMLTYGVPTYRLKNEIALNEIYAIEHLGAKIHYNMKVGRDITLTELQSNMMPFLLASDYGSRAICPFPEPMVPTSFAASNTCACAAWMRSGKLAKI